MMKLNLSDIRYNWVVIFIIQLLLSPGIDVFSQAMPVDTVYNQSYDWRPGQRETLPEWVFASQRKGRVVGISDPCMKSEAARMLALQRAAYLYSLQQGVQLRLLSDVFSTMETASNTYEDQRNKMLVLGSNIPFNMFPTGLSMNILLYLERNFWRYLLLHRMIVAIFLIIPLVS